MSLFVLASKDGWVNIMYTGLDAVGVDMQVCQIGVRVKNRVRRRSAVYFPTPLATSNIKFSVFFVCIVFFSYFSGALSCFASEMTYNVSSGALNSTHSPTLHYVFAVCCIATRMNFRVGLIAAQPCPVQCR